MSVIALLPNRGYLFRYSPVPPNYWFMTFYALRSSYGFKASICLSLLCCQTLDISSAIRQFLSIIDPCDSVHSWVAMVPRTLSVWHCFAAKPWISSLLFASSFQLLIHVILYTPEELWFQGHYLSGIALLPNPRYLFRSSPVPLN